MYAEAAAGKESSVQGRTMRFGSQLNVLHIGSCLSPLGTRVWSTALFYVEVKSTCLEQTNAAEEVPMIHLTPE